MNSASNTLINLMKYVKKFIPLFSPWWILFYSVSIRLHFGSFSILWKWRHLKIYIQWRSGKHNPLLFSPGSVRFSSRLRNKRMKKKNTDCGVCGSSAPSTRAHYTHTHTSTKKKKRVRFFHSCRRYHKLTPRAIVKKCALDLFVCFILSSES